MMGILRIIPLISRRKVRHPTSFSVFSVVLLICGALIVSLVFKNDPDVMLELAERHRLEGNVLTQGVRHKQAMPHAVSPPGKPYSQPAQEPSSAKSQGTSVHPSVPSREKQEEQYDKRVTTTQNAPKRFCDGASESKPCIFDFGFNAGQSSAYYLRDPNARVMAVEANQHLVDAGWKRFASESQVGRFRLVHVGASKRSNEGEVEFWVNIHNSKFSSFMQQPGCRPRNGDMNRSNLKNCRRIVVPTKSCAELLRQNGTPLYLKVDIEGYDRACLNSLKELPVESRPRYVSKENVFRIDLKNLRALGYTKFKVVSQMELELKYKKDPAMRGTSGPWGESAVDMYHGQGWQSFDEIDNRLPLTTSNGEWYDLHAKRE